MFITMRTFKLLFTFVILFYQHVYGTEVKTLVLLDSFAIKETHSMFLQSIKERGHSLIFKLADDSTLSLFKYGDLLFDNLILFTPNVEEFGGRIDVDNILQFIDEGGNVLVVTGNKPGNVLRELGAECGVEVDVLGSTLIDHFNYDNSDVFNHTNVIVNPDKLLESSIIVGKGNTNPILYQGGGFLVNKTNPLVLPLLKAYDTSYCYNRSQPMEQAPNLIGSNIALIAGIQARNNARVIFTGSLSLFSNDAFMSTVSRTGKESVEETGNKQLCESLSKWVFKESGVIRVKSVNYYKEGESGIPTGYTIMDTAIYQMELEEKQGNNWVPFNTDDLQLEFVRIDPFVRTYIPRIADGKYKVVFKIPDVYGVFKFNVDYKRIGYTTIYNSTQVSVRPLKHTEYERFIESAYPYYASAFSMMLGVFVFSFIILHVDVDKSKTE